MIHVQRPRKAPPAFVVAAREEIKRIAPKFLGANGRKPKVVFKAYRTRELVDALEVLFNRKCAYCEGKYASGGYVEVEHYRPKSHYYWLAAEWSNLLPACKRCNNGKLSKFPLADPGKQARKRGEERYEWPLLLNPCDRALARQPGRHLDFAEDGAIRPVARNGRPSLVGATSIEVYRLNRTDLSQERKAWSLRVKQQIAFCELARRSGTPAQQELAYQGLRDLLKADQPFRALTVELLRRGGITTGQSATVVRKGGGR